MSDALWGVVIGAVLAGAMSLLTTWMTEKAAAERENRRLLHEAAQAAEARRQRRIEGTYLNLLGVINELERLVDTDRVADDPPDYEAPTRRLDALWAELEAFASDPVLEVFGKVRGSWLLFPMSMNNTRRRSQGGSVERREGEHLDILQRDLRAAAAALREQVAAELRGDAAGERSRSDFGTEPETH
jgi:type II secretory pathway pseudopilin PulG